MAGLFNALNAARTSLEVSQKQIEITGNNISNVNTEGYSRQDATLNPYPSMNFGDFFVGQGVKITDVRREYNVFVSNQLIEKNVSHGYENGKTSTFAELERVFPITENNLSSDIDTFFDSWQQLSTKPTDIVLRDQVIQQGRVLADRFNSTATQLDQVQSNISDKIISGIEDLNSKLDQVAELNDRIYNIEITGQTANGARDDRDLLLQELASTIGAESYELPNGMVNVQLPAGLPLVNGISSMRVEAETSGSDMNLVLHTAGTTRNINSYNLGGEFAGLIELKDEFIPALEEDLDRLAYELVGQVNALHQAGAGLDGSTGLNFFDDPPNLNNPPIVPPAEATSANWNNAARTMAVSLDDAVQVAAAEAPAAGSSVLVGDNTNALAIADLSYALTIDGADNFDSFYGKMTSTIGIASNQNQLNLGGATDALVQVQNLRDGYAGVSLEEEMIDLIQFQRSFQSSAKFLSTVDEMMTSLIDIK